jgi:hypothetical protein
MKALAALLALVLFAGVAAADIVVSVGPKPAAPQPSSPPVVYIAPARRVYIQAAGVTVEVVRPIFHRRRVVVFVRVP